MHKVLEFEFEYLHDSVVFDFSAPQDAFILSIVWENSMT